MRSPKPPPAPDFAAQATAQGAANKETALATSKLNNPNVINPYGTQNVTYGGPDGLTPTITQTLSPEQQGLYDKQLKTQGLLGDLGNQGAEALGDVIGKNVDMSGLPDMPGAGGATRDRVRDAMMSRYDTDANQRGEQLKSDLVARGLQPGTEAYAREMQRMDNQRNDAFIQADLAGGQEASRDFGMGMDRRRQGLSELLTKRQTPLNELNALMSGSQVSNPFAGSLGYQGGASVGQTPIMQAANQQYGAAADKYNAKVGSRNSRMRGLFGLGAGIAMGNPFIATSGLM